jgi:hypothetical protein
VSIVDSEIEGNMNLRWCSVSSLHLARNNFDVPNGSGSALWLSPGLDPSSVILSGSDTNTFSGNDESRAVSLSNGSSIAHDATWSIDGEASNAVITSGDLNVNGTLNLTNGAIIKNSNGLAVTVNSDGVFVANGTQAEPVVLTSLGDDSIGGDTGGDGATTGSNQDGGLLITSNGGVINVSHTVLKDASSALKAMSVGPISIVDSEINVCIQSYGTPIILQRNQFNIPSVGGTSCAIDASGNSDLSDISLAGSDTNIFNGEGFSRAVYVGGAIVPMGKSWTVGGNSRAVLTGSDMDLHGSLSLTAGAIFKGSANSITVEPGGELSVTGTAASPVLFTSLNDDTVAGDTQNNGSTIGSMGDYGTSVTVIDGGTAAINYASFKYSSVAVKNYGELESDHTSIENSGSAFWSYSGSNTITNAEISDVNTGLMVYSGSVVFRGIFNDVANKAIQACDWNSTDCSVDASYTDWGGAGPTSSLVCGQVTAAPWKNGSTTVDGGLFISQNCNGSTPTPDAQLNTSATEYATRMSDKEIDCSGGFQDACDAIQTAQQCLGAAVSLAASTSSFPLPNGNAYDQPAQWGSMLADNASTYIQSQEGEIPILSAASFGTQLLGAVQTIMNVANAYNTCAP